MMRIPFTRSPQKTDRSERDPLNPLARTPSQTGRLASSQASGVAAELNQYLEQRRLENRSVSPASRGMLTRGTEALEAVRRQIPARGNISADIEKTANESAHRVYASRSVVMADLMQRVESSSKQPPDELKMTTLRAASARIAGAGNCEEFQSATMLEAGKRLRRGEKLIPAMNDERDHAFVQMESKRRDGTTRVVVLDAWANGPAIMAEDCSYAQTNTALHGAELTKRAHAKKADLAATSLVNEFNKSPESVETLKKTLEQRQRVPVAAARIYDEIHVSGLKIE